MAVTPLVYNRDRPIAQVGQEVNERISRFLALGQGDLDFRARFGLGVSLGALVGHHVDRPDAPQPQGLIGDGEIPVRGIEVVIDILARAEPLCTPIGQALFQRGKIHSRELYLDFDHCSVCLWPP